MAWWLVERWEALRLALGARGALPREVGSPPASKGASQASWRLPPLHPLAGFARDWQTSDALRRENAKLRSHFVIPGRREAASPESILPVLMCWC
jgi:hypothetical protein